MPDCVLKAQVTRINKTRWEMGNIMWQVPQKKNKQCIMGKGREATLPERMNREVFTGETIQLSLNE